MPYDWRLNPYVCIKCETRQQACRCCDNGQDSIPFVVVINGCGTFAGRYEFDAVRYKSPTALPSGVSYPATDPCGVFWGTLSAGDGCTANGATWSGSLGLMSWCDGTYAEIPWHVEVFCYDTYLGAWVSQGEATVTSYECLCSGPRFAFTLPEIDCCCDGGTVLTECCGSTEISETLAIEFQTVDAPVTTLGSGTLTYDSGTEEWTGVVTFCGSAADVTLSCVLVDGVYRWQLVTSNGFNVYHSGLVCDPLEIVFQAILSTVDCFGVQVAAYVT